MSSEAILPAALAPSSDGRRQWLLVTAGAGAAAVGLTAVPLVGSFAPSERARAQGSAVEVSLHDLAPGQMKVVEWRGKPVWVMRRTPEQIEALANIEGLADPHSKRSDQPDGTRNATRSLRPEYLVVIGVCTHLGCSPTQVDANSANPSLPANWRGGFFCPCHGSTFDGAGRVFQNKPAPTNLEIPPHRYLDEVRLLIGEE